LATAYKYSAQKPPNISFVNNNITYIDQYINVIITYIDQYTNVIITYIDKEAVAIQIFILDNKIQTSPI